MLRKTTRVNVVQHEHGPGARCRFCDQVTYIHVERLNQEMSPGMPDEITVTDRCIHFEGTKDNGETAIFEPRTEVTE